MNTFSGISNTGPRQPLVTVAAVSQQLSVSERTVRRLAANGVLRGVRVGRQLRFDPNTVAEFVERGGA
jgi:excisionase family DNA binding protein